MRNKKLLFGLVLAGFAAGLYLFTRSKTEPVSQNQISTEVPVSVAVVKREKLTSYLSLVGTINADNDVNVVSQTQGEVKSVNAKVGDYVAAGTVLVQVDDEIKKSNLATAEINYQKAKRDYERNETLYQENSISASQLDASRFGLQAAENQLDLARRQLKDTRIASPISGTVNARMVNIGTMVEPGMTIANIVDISALKVKVNVSEREAFQLKPGDRVEVSTEAYPAKKFEGRVDNIASKADEAHTYPVEIKMQNSREYPLKAGMFARLSFVSVAPREALVIPRDALVGSIKSAQVYLAEKRRAVVRSIVVGSQSDELLEVLDGLQEGDTVVTNGQNNLTNNVPVSFSP